jgi:hypothetical protein
MWIHVWNAYASNNSGSYTLVGRLPSATVAERTAEALRAVIEAHTVWHDAWDGESPLEASPLARFCRLHGLPWKDGDGGWDDWPTHSNDNRPKVAVVGTQVVVHHEYTVSLPPALGAFFYAQGGRVEHEENHAHHPIAVTAMFHWGWTEEARTMQATELPRLLAALTSPDGLLNTFSLRDGPSAAWRTGGDAFGEIPLTVGVVFHDLMAGIAALRSLAETHGARLELRLTELPAEGDPFAHLRPGPATVAPSPG